MKLAWTDEKTSIRKQTLETVTELVRIFILEAIHRAKDVAEASDDDTIDVKHLERIIIQLFLDF